MKKKNQPPLQRFNAFFPEALLQNVPRQLKNTATSLLQSAKNLYEAAKIEAETAKLNSANMVHLLNLVLHCIGETNSSDVKMIRTIIQQLPKMQFN